jgi:hypothetical protein
VAVGAMAVHLAAAWRGAAEPGLSDFHWAFVFTAILTLAGLPSLLALPHDAGAVVSGHRVNAR